MMKAEQKVSALFLFSLLILASCQSRDRTYFGSTTPKHGPGEIWINNLTEPETLDPGKISEAVGIEVVRNIFSGLVQLHPSTLSIEPEIAKSWDISKDGRSYTFHLRPTVWNDGTKMTAHDFEWSWKRVLNPKTASKMATELYPLKNGPAFHQGAIHVPGIKSHQEAKALEDLCKKIAPTERVAWTDWPVGAFIYVKGFGNTKSEHRKKLIQELSGLRFHGRTLTASIADQSVVAVHAKGDYELVVRLESAIPYFLFTLSNEQYMPVPRHLLKRLQKDKINPDLWTRPEYIVSNGPYRLKEWKFRQYMWFEKNPRYWNPQSVRTDRIKTVMVESYNTVLNYFKGGEIDWFGKNGAVPPEYFDYVSRYKDFHNDSVFALYYYVINTKQPPMDDPKVRKAFSLSIDREAIVKHITRAGEIPSHYFVPEGLPSYSSPKTTLYDPELARKYLAEAGYPNGNGFPKFALIYNTSELHKQVAEAIHQMWKKTLGVEVGIENLEWKVYLSKLLAGDYVIARLGGTGSYPDPYSFLENFQSFSGNNYSQWKRPMYDEQLRKANQVTNVTQRMKMLSKAEKMLQDDQPIAPIFVYTRSYMKKPYLLGHWPNLLDRHPWKYMWMDKRWYKGIPKQTLKDEPPVTLVAK